MEPSIKGSPLPHPTPPPPPIHSLLCIVFSGSQNNSFLRHWYSFNHDSMPILHAWVYKQNLQKTVEMSTKCINIIYTYIETLGQIQEWFGRTP